MNQQLNKFDPLGLINEKIKLIHRTSMVAFLSTFIIGMIVHVGALSNTVVNHDSIHYQFGRDFDFGVLGKWAFDELAKLYGIIPTPSFVVPLGILIIAISAALVVNILNVQKNLSAVLISGFMVTFPSIFCVITYRTVDIYSSSLLLSIFAIYAIERYTKKTGIIVAIVSLTVSLGIYQAFASTYITLALLLMVIYTFEKSSTAKGIFYKGITLLLVFIISVALYFVIFKLELFFSGKEIYNYMGIADVGKTSISEIAGLFVETYRHFLKFFLFDSYGLGEFRYQLLYRIFLVLAFLVWSLLFIISNAYKNIGKTLYSIAFISIVPIAINSIIILSQVKEQHWLMMYAYVMIFIGTIKLLELLIDTIKEKHFKVRSFGATISWIAIFTSFALIFTFSYLSNIAYNYQQFTNEASKALVQKVANDVLEIDGTALKTPIIVYSDKYHRAPKKEQLAVLMKYKNITNFAGIVPGYNYVAYYPTALNEFSSAILGYDLNYINYTSEESFPLKIKNSKEFAMMPCYPLKGYVKKIENNIVVKLDDINKRGKDE
ncbi:MAG: glucosyltransferase domain-containing protein [Anaerovoracaceae bacterium]